MCLAIPGRVVAIDVSDSTAPVAEVDYGFTVRRASLLYLPDVRVGEYVVVHAGFATGRVTEAEAREALEYARQIDAIEGSRAPAEPGTPATG